MWREIVGLSAYRLIKEESHIKSVETCWLSCVLRTFLVACTPSSCGIIVNKLITSQVAINAFLVNIP